jgi:hypothetical protein
LEFRRFEAESFGWSTERKPELTDNRRPSICGGMRRE